MGAEGQGRSSLIGWTVQHHGMEGGRAGAALRLACKAAVDVTMMSSSGFIGESCRHGLRIKRILFDSTKNIDLPGIKMKRLARLGKEVETNDRCKRRGK